MRDPAPLSVVIPTLEAARVLRACLSGLGLAAVSGLVREVVVSDGGSTDDTLAIAEAAGARIVSGAPGRGGQLARGAAAARGSHLLFLHADTVLSPSWEGATRRFIESPPATAGVFRLAFDAHGPAPRLVAAGAMIRTRMFRLPYGDQGLLISRADYEAIGGYRDMPLFEDVDLIDRLKARRGRRAFVMLGAEATTSAARYARRGYARRVVKNALCLCAYRAGVSPERILDFYRAA